MPGTYKKNEDFAIIIPDRGDRPELTEHCLFQMQKQTVKPSQIIHIDYKPINTPDLIERIKYGIEMSNYDKIYIIENDDYYPNDYFAKMAFNGRNFVGIGQTLYYNLITLKYALLNHNHEKRSGLAFTGFSRQVLTDFIWPENKNVFLDLKLWKYATNFRLLAWEDIKPLSIKHGIGLCGGYGHDIRFGKKIDFQMRFLKSVTRYESFLFYQQLHLKLLSNGT